MSRKMRLRQKAQRPLRFSFRLTDQSICNQKGNCITSKRLPAFIVTCPVSSADLFEKKVRRIPRFASNGAKIRCATVYIVRAMGMEKDRNEGDGSRISDWD